nr:penicillin-binding transpeptidase domain-containing protein [Micromonospora sp. DSM 115978]
AALLAGLVKNPTAYNPALHPVAATERRNLVLDRMLELGHVSRPDWEATRAAEVVLNMPERRADSCELSRQPFFCAHVRDTLLNDKTFGDTLQDRQRLLFEGGLTIRTTLDPIAQEAAQVSVGEVVPVGDRVAASVVVVEPGTGRVLALAINREYGATADGLPPETTTDSLHTKKVYPVTDFSSPGSTFKTFALAAALESKGLVPCPPRRSAGRAAGAPSPPGRPVRAASRPTPSCQKVLRRNDAWAGCCARRRSSSSWR